MDDAGGPARKGQYDYGYDGVEFGPASAAPDPAPKRPRRRIFTLGRILRGLLALAVIFGLLAAWLSWSLPVSRALEPLPTPALVLVSADGHPFARR
ncbi:MAG TPA: hypothetical protein VJS38_00520, partial [Phenylobacterium sp.]|nr:hypothetical protein [Phenylobacterium sp.]